MIVVHLLNFLALFFLRGVSMVRAIFLGCPWLENGDVFLWEGRTHVRAGFSGCKGDSLESHLHIVVGE